MLVCPYPFIPPFCRATFAEHPSIQSRYGAWRVVLIILGSIACLLTGYRCFVVFRHGNGLQKIIFPCVLLSSSTFIIRGIDPNGYGDKLPLALIGVASALCNCMLYVTAYCTAIVWGTVLTKFCNNDWKFSKWVMITGVTLLLVTCASILSTTIYAANNPSCECHRGQGMTYLILVLLGTLGLGYFSYVGYGLRQKLLDIQEKERALSTVESFQSFNKARISEAPDGKGPLSGRSVMNFPCAIYTHWRSALVVTRMLLAFGVTMSIVIVGQLIASIASFADVYRPAWYGYLRCYDDFRSVSKCDPKFDDEVFTVLQYIFLLACVWGFWKLPKDQEFADIEASGRTKGFSTFFFAGSTDKGKAPLTREGGAHTTSVMTRNPSVTKAGSGEDREGSVGPEWDVYSDVDSLDYQRTSSAMLGTQHKKL